MNQPFTTVTGPAVPLMRTNVDTDVIIRIERLTALGRAELGAYAFEALRLRPDGSEDPDCVLNAPLFRQAPILLAAENFGCGSSREGAVWALQGIGVRCVIAASYGDIFWSNCFQNGVLPITLPLPELRALAAQCREGASVTVDLQTRTVTTPDGAVIHFAIDPLRREALLNGLDDIGLTMEKASSIASFESRNAASRPWA